ncbi:MAG: discoidin domain-containing protein [Pseudomonadota bacterium]
MNKKYVWMFISLTLMACVATLNACSKPSQKQSQVKGPASGTLQSDMPKPAFDNSPQLDMICTNRRPILSIGNPKGMKGSYTVTYEISTDPDFAPDKIIVYRGIEQQNPFISEKQVEPGHELDDGTYYWRARAVDSKDDFSDWAKTRFYVDVKNSRTFSGFLRAHVKDVSVSGGEDPKNIVDWNDQGQITFWNSEPPAAGESFSWVVLDMGMPTPVARFWMLSTRQTTLAAGWLKHFVWQGSHDGKNWTNIEGTEVKDNDTYRNIIDFQPVNSRYYRLVIYSQNALQAQINEIIPYVKGKPLVPQVPDGDYVLLIGNQMNGYTYTQLAKFVEAQGYKTVTIAHQNISLEVLRALKNKPMAIIFSGNNADWQYLPMFEFYGEFEIYREVDDIPMMGICAGNEFYAIAYGMSFAHWMGWFDDTMFRLTKGKTPEKVQILPEYVDDPIFQDMPNPFSAVEIHSWAISPLFLKDERYNEFKMTGKTSYIQTIKSTKRPAYSEQFHGAVVNDYNQSNTYLANFLKIAKKYR